MKKIPYKTTDGRVINSLLPENEKDILELKRLDDEGKLDTNHSFGDYKDEKRKNSDRAIEKEKKTG
jgi:hypothetical protein